MSIKRYVAIKDNTITNAYKQNLTTRGTGSNMGLSDSLEVFSIYAQASSSSVEQAKIIVQFPVITSDASTTIQSDRAASKIPASGSVSFYLRLYNVVHDQTVPKELTLVVSPVSQSWQEGFGLDMTNYTDETYGGIGSNWINAASGETWATQGGSFLTASAHAATTYKQTFPLGTEDLEIDITGLVEQWITGTSGGGYNNYGVGVYVTASQANDSRSFYDKMFSARGSEYFFSRPLIEARWDSSRKDQRGSFYLSSSALSAADNLNKIYLYNYFRGQPANISGIGTGSIYVTLHTSSTGTKQLTTTPSQPVTGGWVSTGIYSASFALSTTASVVYDKWFSGSIYYNTGTIKPKTHDASTAFFIPKYITSITNLMPKYCDQDLNRFRVYTRLKNWNQTIYTVAQAAVVNSIVEDAYYKVYRVIDDYTVIQYGTGSLNQTRLSYDTTGSYFDLDIGLLQTGYEYGIKFVFYINGAYEEQPDAFTFRVE